MQTPWHIRAWAVGASLVINGALITGALYMHPSPPMPAMEETGMLVSLGDPGQSTPENATSPDNQPTPPPEQRQQALPSPAEIKPRDMRSAPDGYVAQAAASQPAPRPAQPQTQPTPGPVSREALPPVGAKAMVATATRPPAGSANADSVQAHAGSSTSYAARVRAWLESNKTYPKAARLRRQQGVARLIFVLDRSGRVLDCRLVSPSGHALLDQEAMAMVARSAPFPAPPHTIKGDRIELDAPVEFSLER